jgi:DNA mismatch repair protein MutS2
VNEKSRKTLEFDKVLAQIATFAFSEGAKQRIMEMRPFAEKSYIDELLCEVEEADKILYQHSLSPSFSVDNITFALEKASVISVLSMGELLKISRTLRISRNLQSLIVKVKDDSITLLKTIASRIFTNQALEEEIENAIISESEMSDNASYELRNIRGKIRRIGDSIKAKLYNFVNSASYSKFLQDNIVTIRNDRYVIPLKAEHRGAIPGLIHDQSSSGATIYLEPMVIVELNNDLKSALIEESKEIERILRNFTLMVSHDAENIKSSFETIMYLDTVFAKAMYANAQKAVKPVINEHGYINIVKGRHPLIAKSSVVSNTVYIGKDFQMLFITGPNTGGKTVCLKLVGLSVIMALSGIYVPAQEAEIGVFENLFCDIGDEQSIEQSLSTFSSHIYNIKHIIDNLNDKTLVLLDELGAGTDPAEGASLALSIATFISKTKARAIITTHYNELKEFAMINKGMQNASMEFDPTTYSPTYKLTIGVPGASNALYIAERLGLNKDIIEAARLGMKGQKIEFEEVLKELQQAKKQAEISAEESERLRKETQRLKHEAEKEREKLILQRERLNQLVRKETKRLVENAMQEANEIIEALKNVLDNPDQSSLFKAYELRKSLKKFIINEENEFELSGDEVGGEIKVGDRVLIASLNSEGIVTALNPIKNEAHISMGSVTTKTDINNLTRLAPSKQRETAAKDSKMQLNNQTISASLNIIGKTTDEVHFYLDEYIEGAYVGGLKEVSIIHGIGEGKLRKAVRHYLSGQKIVASYRDGMYGEGGKGVTVVTLK